MATDEQHIAAGVTATPSESVVVSDAALPLGLRENWSRGGVVAAVHRAQGFIPGGQAYLYVVLETDAMTEVRAEVLEEVEDCINRVATFQKAQGRKVHKYIKRSTRGRDALAELERSGVLVPEDYKALYWNYNGIEPRVRLSFFQKTVFLDFCWSPLSQLIELTRDTRSASEFHDPRMTIVFSGLHGVYLNLSPQHAQDGEMPLVAKMGVRSPKSFVAFGSTLALLRSTCAAQDAGILRYQDTYLPQSDSNSRPVMRAAVQYDVKALWEVIRPFNPRTDYWTAQLDGPIDWQPVIPQMPKDVWDNLPEALKKMVLTPPEELTEVAEAEMRAAGVYEADDPEAVLDARDDALWRNAAGNPGGKKDGNPLAGC